VPKKSKKEEVKPQKKAEPPKVTQASIANSTIDNYIQRAYQKCKGNVRDEEIMTSLLREEVKQASNLGQAERDWSTHPLPLLPSEKLKQSTVSLKDRLIKADGTPFTPSTFNNIKRNSDLTESREQVSRQQPLQVRRPQQREYVQRQTIVNELNGKG